MQILQASHDKKISKYLNHREVSIAFLMIK
jgi:hypothetical protein